MTRNATPSPFIFIIMYDTTKVTDEVTYEKILKYVDEYQIYSHYLGYNLKVNKPMSSPFRTDKHPSWSIFRNKVGNLLWKDFATGEAGNVITFVQKLFDLKFNKALEKVWEDIIAGKELKPKIKSIKPAERVSIPSTIIGITRKYFTKADDEYWEQYGIDREILKYFNVFPIQTFWVNGEPSGFTYNKDNPIYAYKIYDKFKIYRPYAKVRKNKWRNNCSSYDLQGLEQLPDSGDLLIITKSLKDVMTLHSLGYTSVAPQSEQSTIPKKIMDNLKQRFKKIVIFFDYDDGGVEGAKKLSKRYNLKSVFIPKHYLEIYKVKDISDFRKEMSKEKTIELLKELFKEEVLK